MLWIVCSTKKSFIQLWQVGNCGIMGSIIYLFTLQQLLWLQRTDHWSLIDQRFSSSDNIFDKSSGSDYKKNVVNPTLSEIMVKWIKITNPFSSQNSDEEESDFNTKIS